MVQRERIDPWTWQQQYGFAHAWRLTGAEELLFVSGQASLDEQGTVLHAGDIAAQTRLTFENLARVLGDAGYALSDIVKLTAYVVDTAHLPDYGAVMAEFMAGHRPAQTFVGVSDLALPGMLVEVEAIAAR